jgi:TPR repeat protein
MRTLIRVGLSALKGRDYAAALEAAEEGSLHALSYLGQLYEDGRGVTQNYGKAVKLYRRAADKGDPEGQCNLGRMYLMGHGVAQDSAEALKWYRKVADQGVPSRQRDFGFSVH